MRKIRTGRATLMFLAPALIFYGVFMFYPIFQSIWLSFFKWNGFPTVAPKFTGISNYIYMFSDDVFYMSLKNVLLYMILNMLIQLPLGLLLASFLSWAPFAVRYFKAVFFIPVVLSATAVSLMWKFILAPDGIFNTLLTAVGLDAYRAVWLSDPSTNMSAISVVGAWQGVGYVMILMLAGLVSIPRDLMEQSLIDGTTWAQRLRHVTLPLLRPAIRTNIILLIIGSIRVCDIVIVMTNGGPVHSSEVLTTYMLNTSFKEGSFGLGSAIATAIFVLALAAAAIANKLVKPLDEG